MSTESLAGAASLPPADVRVQRLPVVDALRGFALLGILVVNIQYFAYPLAADAADFGTTDLDRLATWLTRALFESKFYVLFSFLFGFGFHVQLERWAADPRRARARYLRRLAGLFAIGALHATLLFAGDILVSYAMLGLTLWFLRGWPDWRLARTAAGFLGLACLLGTLLGGSFAFAPDADPVAEERIALAIDAYRGGAVEAMAQRLLDLQILYLFAPIFTWPTAFVMFLLGVIAGRSGFFLERQNLEQVVDARWLWVVVAALIGNALYAVAAYGTGEPVLSALAFGTLPLTGPLLALVYLRAVWILIERRPHAWLSRALRAAGRLSISNYLLQALMASLIFNGWGLELYARVGPATLFALAFLIFAVQLVASVAWLRYWRSGPAEWLLRALTNWGQR